jgi:hypothetical protein
MGKQGQVDNKGNRESKQKEAQRTNPEDSDSSGAQVQPAKQAKTGDTMDTDHAKDETTAIGGTAPAASAAGAAPQALSSEMQVMYDMINARFGQLERRLDQQGSAIEAVSSGLSDMKTTFQHKFNEQDQKIKAEQHSFKNHIDRLTQDLKDLRASGPASASPSPSQVTAPDAWAAAAAARNLPSFPPANANTIAASGRSSSSAACAASAPTDPALQPRPYQRLSSSTPHRKEEDEEHRKVLVLGLPRDLPATAHHKLTARIAEASKDDIFLGAKALTNGNKVFAILLKDSASARKAASWSKTTALTWLDPRTGTSVAISLIVPTSTADRIRGRAMKHAWALANKHLLHGQHPSFTLEANKGIKLVSDTRKGHLFYKTAEDKFQLFWLTPQLDKPDEYTLHYDPHMIKYFGITVEDVEKTGAVVEPPRPQ